MRHPKNKNILLLMKDGKKIGGTKEVWYPKECTCWADGIWECRCNALKFEGFVGGGKIGTYMCQTMAKIAVEQHLGVTTKKQKIVQPQLIDQKGITPDERYKRAFKKWVSGSGPYPVRPR